MTHPANPCELHIVLPNDIDDPLNPSGGNVYDRRICRGLADAGWPVREHPVWGAWPRPGATEPATLGRLLASLPAHSLVLLDGLIASTVPEVLTEQAQRLRLVILVHMPLGGESAEHWRQERAALSAAVAIVTTSRWSRRRLIDLYGVPEERIQVAPPGVDAAHFIRGSATGSRLLCVAAVTPHKGYDVLVAALARIADLAWSCVCVGPLDRDPGFVDGLRRQTRALGIADRVSFVGPRTGPALEAAYAAADALVLASRGESYGMVVTEALARGIPVLATAAQGLPEALGHAPDGRRPGLLVPVDDAAALAAALRRWLAEPELRRDLTNRARARRATLSGWSTTTQLIAHTLAGITHPLAGITGAPAAVGQGGRHG